MEKLQATKKQKTLDLNKNKKSKNIKNNTKKIKQKAKNNLFLKAFEKNKARFISLTCFYIVTLVLAIISFSNNGYYSFLSKPKVLENSNILIFMIVLLVTMLFLHYILQSVFDEKKQYIKEEKTQVDFEKNQEKINQKKQEKSKVVDITKKSIFAKIREKICKNDRKFAVFISIFVFLLLIILFFNLFVLWICAFLSFLVLFSCIKIFMRSKCFSLRLLSVAIFLNAFCLLISFYFVYLLNWQILLNLEYFRKFDSN